MIFLSPVEKSKIQTSFVRKKLAIGKELSDIEKGASWPLLFIFAAFCPTERAFDQPSPQTLKKLSPPRLSLCRGTKSRLAVTVPLMGITLGEG